MKEQWKPIPGFSGYDASNLGRVRSYRRRIGMGQWAIDNKPQRLLSSAIGKNQRYIAINLVSDDGDIIPMKIHNAVMLAFVGPPSHGEEVCHNDGNTQNNRLENLRYDSHQANMVQRKRHKNNSSGYTGVSYDKGKWRTALQFNNKRYYGGRYDTPEEAARAYDDLAKKLHGEFATLNFPED